MRIPRHKTINLKKLAQFFQDAIHFHPGHLQRGEEGWRWLEDWPRQGAKILRGPRTSGIFASPL